MADAHTKPNHDYHLVNPSPWPIIGSIGAFLMAVGGIMWMKGLAIGGLKAGGGIFIIGFLIVLYVIASWWADVVHHAQTGDPPPVGPVSHPYRMIPFIDPGGIVFVAR